MDRECPECGYSNQPEAKFCGNCGNPLRESASPASPPPSSLPEQITPQVGEQPLSSSRQCPKCHYAAGGDDVFCRRCGARLEESPMFCPRCGDPIDADEKFCNRCGLALR